MFATSPISDISTQGQPSSVQSHQVVTWFPSLSSWLSLFLPQLLLRGRRGAVGRAQVWSRTSPTCPLQAMRPSLFESHVPRLSQVHVVGGFEEEITQRRESTVNSEPL